MLDLAPIIEAVRQAAALCKQVQLRHLAHSDKGSDDPVTIADYGAQAVICRAVSRAFPDDAVLAEEQGSQFVELVPTDQRRQIVELLARVLGKSLTETDVIRWLDHGAGRAAARTWVIDPVDGTKGFVAARHYAIAVGLLEGGQPTAGVVGAPGYGDGAGALFYALDSAAYREPLDGGATASIRASGRTDPAQVLVVESVEKSHSSHSRMERALQLAGLGAARVVRVDSMEKYALVACGDADLYLRLPRLNSVYKHNVWDHAAGTALVLAAGGMVSDVDGSPLDFSRGPTLPNAGMIVSNGKIHERVVQAVQALMRAEAESQSP